MTHIKELRNAKGWTQTELARRAGLTKNSIYAYESNKKSPTVRVLTKIASALGTTVQELI